MTLSDDDLSQDFQPLLSIVKINRFPSCRLAHRADLWKCTVAVQYQGQAK